MSLFALFFWSFALFLISCEIGERAINECNKIEYEIYEFDWYTFPIEIRKILPTLILVAQEKCVVKLFGSNAVCRNTFGCVSVINDLYMV